MAKRVNFWELPVEAAQPDDTLVAYRGRGKVARVRLPAGGGGEGTVTSVGVSMPTGFAVANSPVTTSGTITVTFAAGYGLPTTTQMGQWSAAFAWGDHALAGYALAASLAAVATSGNYSDLSGTPTLGTAASKDVPASGNAASGEVVMGSDSRLTDARTPTAHTHPAEQITGLAPVATSGSYDDLTDKPVIRDGTVTSVDVSVPTGLQVSGGPITSSGTITISYASGYAIPTTVKQGQWDTAYSWGNHASAGYALASAVTSALAGKVDKVAGKGLSTEDYTPAEKSKLADIEAGAQVNTVTSVAGKTGAVTLAKDDVGLGNVDNTSDADKPISTAVSTALSGKVDTSDARLTDAREWSASTVSQAEAEAGTATTRRAWTAQRVRQAVAAYTYDKPTIVAMVTDDANKNFTWLATTTTLTANAANAVNFSSPRTLTLPGTPAENEYVIILRTAGTTVGSTIARNGQTIMGVAEDMTLDANVSYLRLDFVDSSWRIAS